MFSWPTIRSVLFKFLYGVLAATLAAVLGIIQANPDPATFTLTAVKIGVITAVVAFAKKFVFNFFVAP